MTHIRHFYTFHSEYMYVQKINERYIYNVPGKYYSIINWSVCIVMDKNVKNLQAMTTTKETNWPFSVQNHLIEKYYVISIYMIS